jgi:tetratricopeptide (TPR) repeat protein
MKSTIRTFAALARRRLRGPARPVEPMETPALEPTAHQHLARADCEKARGDTAAAAQSYRKAFELDPYLVEAHASLAGLIWPGPDYLAWLAHFHAIRCPRVYLEIGVATGRTLALARPPTCAIGIDPQAMIQAGFSTETHLYCETSNDFFGANRLNRLLGSAPVDFGFIDGLHLFEQALRDFIHLEARCAPGSLILLHDTIPLDERTQERVATTNFYTGDVWKIVPCLKLYRPDLRVATIAAAPTGLTAVSSLDPSSRVLAERYDEAVARFIDMPYAEAAADLRSLLNIVPNDWEQARL